MADLYVVAGSEPILNYVNDNYVAAGLFIDWANKIIHVPRTYLLLTQLVPTEVRELDLNQFRLDLKALEASLYGMSYLDTHQHNPPVTVGGVTLARVVEIINGYTVTFEDGQYAVNIVGGNSNVADVVNPNQVSVRSANSAGLTYSKEIEDLSFTDSRVWINTEGGGSTSTQYPSGTPAQPVANYNVAEAIVELRGLSHRYRLNGAIELFDDGDTEEADWLGSNADNAHITLSGVQSLNYVFQNCTITGTPIGHFSARGCELIDLFNYKGTAHDSGIGGTITLPSGISDDLLTFHQCYSNVPGTGTPTLDCNDASNLNVQFRAYAGGITIKNYSSPDNALTVDMISGHTKLDSTCTAGTIVVRGAGRITDNSGPGCTVVQNVTPVWSVEEKDATLLALTSVANTIALLQKYQENRQVIDKIANTLTIYDDDDVTPILVFSLLNSLGAPSTDEVAERVPQ